MRNNRTIRSFTLLEVMIALVVLLLMGTITAVQIQKLIQVHGFERQVTQFFHQIQEAQGLSSIYQTDIAFDLVSQKGKLSYQFSTLEPSLPLEKKIIPLSRVKNCTFNTSKIQQHKFSIYSGKIEPRGVLCFEQNDRKFWIDLQYGQLLKFSSKKPATAKLPIPQYIERPTKDKPS